MPEPRALAQRLALVWLSGLARPELAQRLARPAVWPEPEPGLSVFWELSEPPEPEDWRVDTCESVPGQPGTPGWVMFASMPMLCSWQADCSLVALYDCQSRRWQPRRSGSPEQMVCFLPGTLPPGAEQ
jgi:hypothetical protein